MIGRLAFRPVMTVVALMIAGCSDLFLPPGVQRIPEPDRTGWINPDEYRVKSDSYPEYRAIARVEEPPSQRPSLSWIFKAVPIETADVWRVTHRLGDRLLLYSETYQQRQCHYDTWKAEKVTHVSSDGGRVHRDGTCDSMRYLNHLVITPNGEVLGWKGLKNPALVVFASDRRVPMDIDEGTTQGWGTQPVLKANANASY